MHLLTIYLVWVGTWLSAYFIIAANSWMQHPVGYRINDETGRAQATDIWQILFQRFAVVAYVHVILAGLMTGGFLVLGVACWHLLRGRNVDLMSCAAKLAIIIVLPVSVIQLVLGQRVRRRGDRRAADEDRRRPRRSGTPSSRPRSRSSRSAGSRTTTRRRRSRSRYPGCSRSWRRTLSRARSSGSTAARRSEQQFGSGNYIPDVRLAYWSMRVMAYLGDALAAARRLGLLAAPPWRPGRTRSGSSAPRSQGSRCRSCPASAAGC